MQTTENFIREEPARTIRNSTLMDVLFQLGKMDKDATLLDVKLMIHQMMGEMSD